MSILTTVDAIGLREDLTTLDLMGDKNTVAFNKAKKLKANAAHYEWLEDNLSQGNANNASVQGATFNFSTTNTRLRKGNYTQIFKQTPGISRTVNESKLANGADNASITELAAEIEKAMLQNTRDIDAAMLIGSAVAPTDAVAGQMAGIIGLTATAQKYTTAGTDLAWKDMDDTVKAISDAGASPDTVIASDLKAVIASLNKTEAPIETVNMIGNGDIAKLRGSFLPIDLTTATVEVHYDPRMTAGTLAAFDSSRWGLAVLGEANKTNDITFDGVGKAIITECCAKLSHSKAAAILTLAT